METPIFKLPGIIKEEDDNVDFEGPLTLILQLLSKDKVEIKDISIASILEQYLAYLAKMAEMNLEIASEFIVMASNLMHIKTKQMLSDGEEITEYEQLITSLEQLQRSDMYLQIKEAAQTLSGMYSRDGFMMAGPPEYIAPDTEYQYVHISKELLDAIERVVGKEYLKLASMNTNSHITPDRVAYPISDKITEITEKMKRSGDVTVGELFLDCSSRTELIAVVIAVLELCRVGSVLLSGDPDDMKLSYTGAGREDLITDFTIDDITGGEEAEED